MLISTPMSRKLLAFVIVPVLLLLGTAVGLMARKDGLSITTSYDIGLLTLLVTVPPVVWWIVRRSPRDLDRLD